MYSEAWHMIVRMSGIITKVFFCTLVLVEAWELHLHIAYHGIHQSEAVMRDHGLPSNLNRSERAELGTWD